MEASQDHLPVVVVSVIGAEHHAIVDSHGSVFAKQFRGPLQETVSSSTWVSVHWQHKVRSFWLNGDLTILGVNLSDRRRSQFRVYFHIKCCRLKKNRVMFSFSVSKQTLAPVQSSISMRISVGPILVSWLIRSLPNQYSPKQDQQSLSRNGVGPSNSFHLSHGIQAMCNPC